MLPYFLDIKGSSFVNWRIHAACFKDRIHGPGQGASYHDFTIRIVVMRQESY
jgi:hypothetical protein